MSDIATWHKVVETEDATVLKSIVSKDATFYSPIVFKPQTGRKKVMTYLMAAAKVLKEGGFSYVKELDNGKCSMLEFSSELDGVKIEGIDIITWDEDNKITEFKVMIRPFRAIEKVGEKMKQELESMSLFDKVKFALG